MSKLKIKYHREYGVLFDADDDETEITLEEAQAISMAGIAWGLRAISQSLDDIREEMGSLSK